MLQMSWTNDYEDFIYQTSYDSSNTVELQLESLLSTHHVVRDIDYITKIQ